MAALDFLTRCKKEPGQEIVESQRNEVEEQRVVCQGKRTRF